MIPFLLMVCTGVSASSIDIYLPALPELSDFFHTTDNILRISVMISPMVSAFTGLCYGRLSDIYGRRIIFLTCFLVFSIGSLWCGFSDSALEFLIARFVQALGSTGMGLLTITILSDLFSGITLARYLSISSLLYPISFALAPNVGAFIMVHTSWRGMFFFLALTAMGLLFVLARYLPETLQKDAEDSHPGLSIKEWGVTIVSMVRNKRIFRNMAFTNALAVAINQIFITNAPFMFEEHFHFSKLQYTNLLIIPHSFNILGCVLYSIALRRTTPKICLNVARGVLLVFLVLTVLRLCLSGQPPAWSVIALYSMCSFGLSFLIMTSVGFAISDLNTNKGLGTGVIQFIRNMFASLMVMVSGYFCQGFVTPVFIAISLCTVSVLLIISVSYPHLPDLR